MKRNYKKKKQEKKIAKQRIEELFKQAREMFKKDKKLSNRYVKLARKISMKYKTRIPSELKRQFCKHCYCFLMPGKNCTVRTQGECIVYTCKECKKYSKFRYKD